MQSKYPASDMVFGAFASDGKVTPLHFVEACPKINSTEKYLNILEEVLLLWIKKNYDPMKIMFICVIQASASAQGQGSKTV